ncbi:hypothetical protein [Basfia succiniciproducens]|uniref:hypothetical protein n=1 Tax=Basfia succiniciproducens TaxID=653940 RepID=UPI0008B94129|nr:hypothetical protein [Basfia succiniciproducens]SEQ64325.1 hypothetical protein SAMN02910415_01805 [Basfia succiniciproducens]
MKIKPLFLSLFCLAPAVLNAQWANVGKADYNWGPFLVYTVSFDTENGEYQDHQSPLMFSFDYAKPVEGKNFSIILIKEMTSLGATKEQTEKWLKELSAIPMPDFLPNDRLSYIALENTGYFILNDQVLDHYFDAEFNQYFIQVWLSGKTGFAQLQNQLLGKEKGAVTESHPRAPEVAPLTEEDADPQLPPNYQLTDRAIINC